MVVFLIANDFNVLVGVKKFWTNSAQAARILGPQFDLAQISLIIYLNKLFICTRHHRMSSGTQLLEFI